MAHIANVEKTGSLLVTLGRTLAAVNTVLMSIAEGQSQIRKLKALNQVSDSELEARGTTREAEIRRAIGVSAWL